MKCAVAALLLVVAVAATAPAAAAPTVPVPQRASLVLAGEHRSDQAGASVALAGDVNDDRKADLIIGAPKADPRGRTNAGAAYVVFGPFPRGRLALGALAGHGFRIDGAVALANVRATNWATDGAGAVVAGAGDVNGDGLADLLVTGRLPSLQTAAFVVYGKRDANRVDLAALGSGGFAIADDAIRGAFALGDVNDDGLADVGIATSVEGDEAGGALRVVFGRSDPAAPDRGFLIRGDNDDLQLGSAAAAAGDVNHDGVGDVLIGAPGADIGNAVARGVVFVWYGRRDPVDTFIRVGEPFAGSQVTGPKGVHGFGASVVRHGNGFVAGAPGASLLSTRPGSAWIVTGNRRVRLAGPRAGGPIGLAVAAGNVVGGPAREVITLARGRAGHPATGLLFSARGRHLRTYTGLRKAHRRRGAVAIVGSDLLFGSPGAGRAYLIARPTPTPTP
jgi:FG-GAP repeat protein